MKTAVYSFLIFLFIITSFSCQKTKWNRQFASRSGTFKLTRYEVNGEDKTKSIESFIIDFKDKKPGYGQIKELITTADYSKGYNSCFNIEGAVKIPENLSIEGPTILLSFTNSKKYQSSVGFLEVLDKQIGGTRSIKPLRISRTQFTFEFPYSSQNTKADTSEQVIEKYYFEKLY